MAVGGRALEAQPSGRCGRRVHGAEQIRLAMRTHHEGLCGLCGVFIVYPDWDGDPLEALSSPGTWTIPVGKASLPCGAEGRLMRAG